MSSLSIRAIAAPPEIASGSLALIAACGQLRSALAAFGIDDRVVSVEGTDGPGLRLVWCLPGESRGELLWVASVEAAEDGGSLLSVSLRVGASDTDSGKRLLAAWHLLAPLVDDETRRILSRVAANAEQLSEDLVAAPAAAA